MKKLMEVQYYHSCSYDALIIVGKSDFASGILSFWEYLIYLSFNYPILQPMD